MRLVPLALLLLLVTGCSGPSDDAADRPSASSGSSAPYDEAAVHDGLATEFAGTNPTPREERAGGCFADELVGTATPEQLREGGLVAEDGGGVEQLPPLPDDLAELAADATLACVDVVESSTRAVTSVRKGDLDPVEYADCLVDAVPDDAQREALVATLAGRYDDPAVARLGQAQADCAAEQD